MPDKEVTSNDAKPARYWVGDAPTHCDICGDHIGGVFVDGVTVGGRWANMCSPCHVRHGYGFGQGRGQRYSQQGNGRWRKTAG